MIDSRSEKRSFRVTFGVRPDKWREFSWMSNEATVPSAWICKRGLTITFSKSHRSWFIFSCFNSSLSNDVITVEISTGETPVFKSIRSSCQDDEKLT